MKLILTSLPEKASKQATNQPTNKQPKPVDNKKNALKISTKKNVFMHQNL